MSGRRCKALRRDFFARHGRAPVETEWKKVGDLWGSFQVLRANPGSEWRRLKAAHKARPLDALPAQAERQSRRDVVRVLKRKARRRRSARRL